jgi:hypothetical protein
MPRRRFKVKGESTVVWELEIEADEDFPGDVEQRAKEYVHDMLDLSGIGRTKAAIQSQEDRVLSRSQITPEQEEEYDEADE